MVGTIWTLLPPILAIALALLTKEVYMSLFAGIVLAALLYSGGNVPEAIEVTVEVMGTKVSDNICIIIFLVLLGMLVSLLSKSGASKAYGEWASRNIKTKRGSLLATSALGVLIFVDDYFNCLTVGTIMKPITDKHKISRAKLAYIIDATAAPICIIAPVSSWAAAVSSSLPEGSGLDGFMLFIKAIPYNYYALFTLLMVVLLIIWNFDFGKMKQYEIAYGTKVTSKEETNLQIEGNGKVKDLLIPIGVLIVFCISAMLYTGGITEGAGIRDAFANCDAAFSLVIGSFFTVVMTALLYIPRKIISFRSFADSLTDGFKAMVPAILILTFAWSLSGICDSDYLGIDLYVSGVISESSIPLGVIPVIFFLVALGLAFSTGTSWGTFAILLPIIVAVFDNEVSNLLLISMSAVMAGAVCGDHISPISDTTILSSTGAECDHIEHVRTQIPYAMLVAVICCICYIVAGVSNNGLIGLGLGIVLLVGTLYILKRKNASSKI